MQLPDTLWLLVSYLLPQLLIEENMPRQRGSHGIHAQIGECCHLESVGKKCTNSSMETKTNTCWKGVKFRLKSYSERSQTRGEVMEYEEGNWIKRFSLKESIRQDDNVLVCLKWTGKKQSWKSLNWTLCEPFWKKMLQHTCTEYALFIIW